LNDLKFLNPHFAEMDTSSPATLVNAQMLNMFVGRRVRTVVQVQHNEGGVLVGQSTDGHQLCVKSAMDVPVSHFMEVYGIAENSQTIHAKVCTDFGPNFGEISNAFGVCLGPLIAIV
jgi:replication factor A3